MSRIRIEKNIAYDERNRLYYVTFHYGTDDTGRRIKRTKTYPSHAAAAQALQIFEQKKQRGEAPLPSEITLGLWLEQWLSEVVTPNRACSTAYGYGNIIRVHLKPALGAVILQELTPAQIQGYYAAARESGLCANTVRKHHQLLFAALECAVRWDLLRRNPARQVEAPPRVTPQRSFYTTDQLRILFSAVHGERLEAAVKLAGYLGLRRGEICGLKWENVDLENGTITICTARTTVGGVTFTKEPKTPSSVRTLGIAGLTDLENMLRTLRSRQVQRRKKCPGFNAGGYVLVRPNGRPYAPDYVSSWFTHFVAAHHLPYLTLHGLRHSFASAANELRIPMFNISKALGHSSTSVTSQVYTHLFDDTQNAVLHQVADAISAQARA